MRRKNYRKICQEYYGYSDEQMKSMHVHHIDGNRDNNNPKNLQLVTPEEHAKIHIEELNTPYKVSGKWIKGAAEAGRKGGKSGKGWKFSDESKKRLSESLKKHYSKNSSKRKGTTMSDEFKRKMSLLNSGERNSMYGKHHSEKTKKRISKIKKHKYANGDYSHIKPYRHNENDKQKISESRKQFFKSGGINSNANRYDVYNENGLLLENSTKKEIIEKNNLTDRQYRTLLKYCRNYDKIHPRMKLKLVSKGKVYA